MNLATPSSIFIFVFSSSTGELCSQPIRGNDRRIGRMFLEHIERSFLDPEYSFDEYFQLGSRRNIRPIKNGLQSDAIWHDYQCSEMSSTSSDNRALLNIRDVGKHAATGTKSKGVAS